MSVFQACLLQLLLLLLALQCSDELYHCNAATLVPTAEHPANCIESERMALLDFKKYIKDPNNKLFLGQDKTAAHGMVSTFKELKYLNLSGAAFDGPIPSSFGNLSSLQTLDLSNNFILNYELTDFQWLSNLTSLQFIDMSAVSLENMSTSLFVALNKLPFINEILSSPFNLQRLEYLDLSNNYNAVKNEHDFQWLSHLTSLQHFDMSFTALGNSSISMFLALNKLPSINEIHLDNCEIEKFPHSIPHLNFSVLSFLDLSYNHIDFSEVSWVFSLTSLQYLDLSRNDLDRDRLFSSPDPFRTAIRPENSGQPSKVSIPESMGNLCRLQTLDLSYLSINKRLAELEGVFSGCLKDSLTHLYLRGVYVKGEIPDWVGDIKNLKLLDLSNNILSGSLPSSLARLSSLEKLLISSNELNGTLPEEIGKLAELVYLDLSDNQLHGDISESHFAQLEKLDMLDLSLNSLVFNVSSDWVPPFLLQGLSISNCSVGLEFPTWLQRQHKMNTLAMSHAGISDTIPDWLGNLTSHNLAILDLSHNQIEGIIPKSLNFTNMYRIDLSSNQFYGPLPVFAGSRLVHIDLSNNSFSGFIPPNIIDELNQVFLLSLSMNKLSGSIPSSFCQMRGLMVINVSKNQISDMNLANNNISGSIPSSICRLPDLRTLALSHNAMLGEFPVSMKDCSRLAGLDLSYNNFTGRIPNWVGQNLSSLSVLILKSNTFTDHIPEEISQLEYLQIIDLSNNNLSGPVPKGLGNITTMQTTPENTHFLPLIYGVGQTISLSFNQREDDYNTEFVPYVKYIDLSINNLSGSIPEELASLYGLQSLNLSGNMLEGEIPNKLGRMRQLQSLDLSRNKLSGSIPSTLAKLTFLGLFNVSHNNLSGRIPSGNQFNTFTDPSIYTGNHLCGFPLSDNCTKDGETSKEGPKDDEPQMDEDDDDIMWLYIGSLSGFAVGSSVVWVVLALKKKWRHAYFRSADNTYDKIYVFVVVRFKRMKEKFIPNN
ncbi:receptor-like protein EIX1 [Dioscorea cayenensis subsp. rotundata]|uniref:Receptor-like protein EIX1 n=1 Tax=Dioscorea cayennensis subsp. rotundata TaxID=55577 RepID=A0AB40AP11_DIOCR|nr:receptor-like protein EIX1 [Dioscorea cayenensis subsp. rotundata]